MNRKIRSDRQKQDHTETVCPKRPDRMCSVPVWVSPVCRYDPVQQRIMAGKTVLNPLKTEYEVKGAPKNKPGYIARFCSIQFTVYYGQPNSSVYEGVV